MGSALRTLKARGLLRSTALEESFWTRQLGPQDPETTRKCVSACCSRPYTRLQLSFCILQYVNFIRSTPHVPYWALAYEIPLVCRRRNDSTFSQTLPSKPSHPFPFSLLIIIRSITIPASKLNTRQCCLLPRLSTGIMEERKAASASPGLSQIHFPPAMRSSVDCVANRSRIQFGEHEQTGGAQQGWTPTCDQYPRKQVLSLNSGP
jgi:hypothetical protein